MTEDELADIVLAEVNDPYRATLLCYLMNRVKELDVSCYVEGSKLMVRGFFQTIDVRQLDLYDEAIGRYYPTDTIEVYNLHPTGQYFNNESRVAVIDRGDLYSPEELERVWRSVRQSLRSYSHRRLPK